MIAIELINKLWYRTIAKIKWLFFGSTQEASASRPSPIAELPQELVEVIVSYFIYDICTLLACSMTCFSWYIAAVPHLHHSLTTDNGDRFPSDRRYTWPRPLRKSYQLGLLPLVKRFRIRLGDYPLFLSSDHAELSSIACHSNTGVHYRGGEGEGRIGLPPLRAADHF